MMRTRVHKIDRAAISGRRWRTSGSGVDEPIEPRNSMSTRPNSCLLIGKPATVHPRDPSSRECVTSILQRGVVSILRLQAVCRRSGAPGLRHNRSLAGSRAATAQKACSRILDVVRHELETKIDVLRRVDDAD